MKRCTRCILPESFPSIKFNDHGVCNHCVNHTPTKYRASTLFNIGTGTTVSVNQVANALKQILRRNNLKNIHSDPHPSDIRHGYADISKARKILGYNPTFSLKEGLNELVNWHSKKIPNEGNTPTVI